MPTALDGVVVVVADADPTCAIKAASNARPDIPAVDTGPTGPD
jgi:hypothetical protein